MIAASIFQQAYKHTSPTTNNTATCSNIHLQLYQQDYGILITHPPTHDEDGGRAEEQTMTTRSPYLTHSFSGIKAHNRVLSERKCSTIWSILHMHYWLAYIVVAHPVGFDSVQVIRVYMYTASCLPACQPAIEPSNTPTSQPASQNE